MIIGYRAFSFFSKERYALSVLATILGGGMASRLFIELREKRGLCYYISTGLQLYHDVGSIYTQAGVGTDSTRVNEAIKVILAEHQKIADGDVSHEEITRAKELIKGHLILSLEDSQSVASFFARRQILENKYMKPEEVIAEINNVTKDQIVALAKQLFKKSGLNIAIVGPFTKKNFPLS